MLEEICIIFITIWTCSLAFNFSCPGSGQWNFRAMFYCSDLNKYTCLLDTSKTRYTETCDGPRDEVNGHKSTINRNNFDTAKCSPDRFQPIDFITVGNSDCVFQKSKCAQEGQIAAHEIKEKNSLLDTNCLCDYTKGYSFINLPKDKCYCNPLVSDCSCFREFCPSGKILSPDYQCTTQIDMINRKWNCSKIASADDSQNGDQVQQFIKDIDPKNERRSRIAVQVIVPILVSIMAGLLIWCWKTSKLDKVKERIKCLVCEKGDDNESEEIIMTTETQHSPKKNDKIQHKLPEKDNDNESKAIIIPTEIILPSDKNDEIQHESFEKEDGNKSEAINLSPKIPHSPDRNDEIQHELPEKDNDNESKAIIIPTEIILPSDRNDEIQHESFEKEDGNMSEAINLSTKIPHSPDKNDEIQHELSRQRDSKTSVHDISSSQEELKYNQIDGRTTDQISQTKQNDSSSSEDEDELSFKSTHSSVTGLNEYKNSVTNNSTELAKEQKDKSDELVGEICSVVAENEKTSSKQHKEENDDICIVVANKNAIEENKEMSCENANTDKSKEPVEETGTVNTHNENTSINEHKDKKYESNEETFTDGDENIKIKENEEWKMTKFKFETHDSDESVNTETVNVTEITEESFNTILKDLEESESTKPESADSGTDKGTTSKDPKPDD